MSPNINKFDYDYIIIGSGFGGSVSALRLTEKGYRVAVMEMGRRFSPADMPDSGWNLRKWIWRPQLGLRGFFNMQLFRHALILHGCAVGGGSITYANTMLSPPEKAWQNGTWKHLADWKHELQPHFQTAEKMLGVTDNRILGPSDYILKQAADSIGRGNTFYPTRIAVFQPPEGETGGKVYPDPYFQGEGPERRTCIGCGGCMMGCQHNAKNTLDKNYLYLAEKKGAAIFAETKVIDVQPLVDLAGEQGYRITTQSTRSFRGSKKQYTAQGVIFSASALGTLNLLFDLKDKKSLPHLSPTLGTFVRTNAESLVGLRIPQSTQDLSQGVAIGSGVYIDSDTHIEATRYPRGSNPMALLATIMTGGRPGHERRLLWLGNILKALFLHPLKLFRLLRPHNWSQEVIIFLCMQALDGHLTMKWKRPWYWPFSKTLTTAGAKIPTFIPAANEFAFKAAKLTGGTAMSMTSEILLNIPSTAHILGGCPMGETSESGVINHRHEVFNYKNMYVCDGSTISANLGVNPSLTICALTERAMDFIPSKK